MVQYPTTATLGNEGDMTVFQYGGQCIKFRAPHCLDRYLSVTCWDNGYLEVMARYTGIGDVEEYIDLRPVLENLYIDPDTFLRPIQNVVIQ